MLAGRPGFLIRRLHQIHLALFAEECGGFGVTPVQFSVLTVVGDAAGIEQGVLAEAIGVDRTTLANVLGRMERRGDLTRAVAPGDRRVRLVTLTDAGLAVLGAMEAAAERAHARTMEALPAGERAVFMAALGVLVAAGNGFGRAPMRLA